jgi:endonuclease/exonuclease/phosphatase (EEP) superfamily protein YafD
MLSIAAWFDNYSWVTFQLAQFRLQWAEAALLLMVFAFIQKRLRLGVMIAGLLLLNAVPLLSVFVPPFSGPTKGTPITVLQINVMSGNKNYDRVRQLIADIDPDLLLIEELTPTWQKELQPALKRLPFALTDARLDTYGIGVFSSVPLKLAKVLHFGPTGHPSIDCTCNWGRNVRILHTHLQGPVRLSYYQAQVSELAEIVHYLQGATANMLFCGDMNTMSSVAPFYNAAKQLNLTDSRQGRGLLLSWPTTIKLPIPLLTIDHIFVGSDIDVLERKVGPNIGSDHFPVIVRLAAR